MFCYERRRKCRLFSIVALLALLSGGVIFAKTLLLDDSDNKTHVGLYVGDTLSVKLKSNGTTGYSWSAKELPPALKLLVTKNESGKGIQAGEPGFQIFAHKAVATGVATLRMEYSRPFEKGTPPVSVFTVSISVEQRPAPPKQ